MHWRAHPLPTFPLLSSSQTIQSTPMLFQISAKSVWCHLRRNKWPSSPNTKAFRKLRSDSLSQTICHMAVRTGQFMKGWGSGWRHCVHIPFSVCLLQFFTNMCEVVWVEPQSQGRLHSARLQCCRDSTDLYLPNISEYMHNNVTFGDYNIMLQWKACPFQERGCEAFLYMQILDQMAKARFKSPNLFFYEKGLNK